MKTSKIIRNVCCSTLSIILCSTTKKCAVFIDATVQVVLESLAKHEILLGMSEGEVKKNISRIRTFKSDSQKAQASSSVSNTTILTKPVPVEIKNIPSKNKPITAESFFSFTKNDIKKNIEQETQAPEKLEEEMDSTSKYKKISEEIAHVAKTQKYSILSDTDNEYDVDAEIAGGVIIRDTKHKRFKLVPALIEATTQWYKKTREKQTVSRMPKHTVAKVETRVEVVEKATEGSEHAPKEDVLHVTEHLRNIIRTPISTAINIKAKEEVEAPSWARIGDVDPKEATLKAQEEALAQLKKITDAVETIKEKDVVEVEIKTPAVVHPKLETSLPTEQVTPVVETILQERMQSTTPLQTLEKAEEQTVVKIASIPQKSVRLIEVELKKNLFTRDTYGTQKDIPEVPLPVITTAPEKKQVAYAPPREEKKSSLYFYTLIGVIFFSSILGVTVTYYLYTRQAQSQNTQPEIAIVSPSVVRSQSTDSFMMPKTASAFIQEVQKKIIENDGVVELKPKVQEGTQERDATAAEILDVLQPHVPGSFARSITEIRFGGINGDVPFIIITTTSFDSAFAGILNWERYIIQDISPLFGNTSLNQNTFKDLIAVNKNVRLLIGQNGDDVLVYTFKDQNTLVITQSRKALEELLPLVE